MSVEKFWSHIETRLITCEKLYYAGGTLCVDNIGKSGGIGLNLNGKGFVFTNHPHMKNSKVYLPSHITKMVHDFYKEVKGEKRYQHRMQEIEV